jgi:hypothetical protein
MTLVSYDIRADLMRFCTITVQTNPTPNKLDKTEAYILNFSIFTSILDGIKKYRFQEAVLMRIFHENDS